MGVGDAQGVRCGAQNPTAQLGQKKIFRPGFPHSRAQSKKITALEMVGHGFTLLGMHTCIPH